MGFTTLAFHLASLLHIVSILSPLHPSHLPPLQHAVTPLAFHQPSLSPFLNIILQLVSLWHWISIVPVLHHLYHTPNP